MSSKSQRTATRTHRRRAKARGLVRVEVKALRSDAGLIRAVAEMLRGENADTMRHSLETALIEPEANSVLDVFGSDLPDEAFKGVFNQPRQRVWRKLDL